MYQKKSNPWARLKYAYVLPLAVTAVALFAQPGISQPFAEISNAKISHFFLETGKNEVKNLPETEISDLTLNEAEEVKPHELVEQVILEDTTIFVSTEIPAKFPGGDAGLLKWISVHLQYPVEAIKDSIQGRVSCMLIIEKDGSVSNVELIRSSSNRLLDEEAIRVLKTLPKFTPAEQRGQRVRTRCAVPVRFMIEK